MIGESKMLLLRLWNYIRGYVIIIVEGNFLEKFINICIHRQILLWDIKKQKNNKMILKISIRGFLLLRPIAKKTGCRIRIKSKRGMPFLINRYKGRKTFLFGGIIAIILIYILTSFVWVVEVSGNKKVETQAIVDRLAYYGAKPGILKYGINTKVVSNEMMLDMKELAWISITVKGTKIKVKLTERVDIPELVPKDIPCNIVANRDGVIKSVITKAGQAKVKSGEMVSKGDVLISGTITSESKDLTPYQVHSIGNIFATTWYEKTCPVETIIQEKIRTGKVKNKYSLGLFTKKLKLFFEKVPPESYEKVELKKKLSLGKDLVLPFEFITDKYFEQEVIQKEISIDEAKQLAIDKAYNEASADIPEEAEIIKTNTTFFKDETGRLNADVIIECTEDIGKAEIIGGN
jgi:similar to stage IV sporulation protein